MIHDEVFDFHDKIDCYHDPFHKVKKINNNGIINESDI